MSELAKALDTIAKWTPEAFKEARACFCVGPQGNAPLCPCQMRNVQVRDGRYVTVIDHGPAPSPAPLNGKSEK